MMLLKYGILKNRDRIMRDLRYTKGKPMHFSYEIGEMFDFITVNIKQHKEITLTSISFYDGNNTTHYAVMHEGTPKVLSIAVDEDCDGASYSVSLNTTTELYKVHGVNLLDYNAKGMDFSDIIHQLRIVL